MPPVHREGYSTLAGAALVLALLNAVLALMLPRRALTVSLSLSAAALGFLAQFFRNPPRQTPDCPDSVIAPADGTIVAVERTRENEFFHDERLKISIYMSALNVHLNRVPASGRVVYSRYHPGQYLIAFHPKASELNERNTVVIERGDGTAVLVRQIAGILARRIVYYLRDGQQVQAGDELGFIKFGSRCDVFLPVSARAFVEIGDKVKGGETMLAEMSSPDAPHAV